VLDKNALKQSLTEEEVIKLVTHLGSEDYKIHREGLIFNTCVCHGGNSYKLYYYTSNKLFHCYTHCDESFDIYTLVQKAKGISFLESVEFVADFVGRKPEADDIPRIDDWKWINKLSKKKRKQIEESKIKILDKRILNQFIELPHIELLEEGINYDTQKIFRIGFSLRHSRITIPIFDQYGNLLSVKGRIIKELEDEYKDKKYIALYPYEKSKVLYGLHKTYPFIDSCKQIIVFESEKSVLKSYSIGYKNCVAIGGKDISSWQCKKIIGLANNVIIAFDKDVEREFYKKIVKMFKPYVNLEIIYDKWGKLGDKDSPCDCGLDVWNYLYQHRFKIN